MRKAITLLALFFSLLIKAQITYIPMPDGYGTDGSNKAALPLFEFGGFLYCKTKPISNTQEGRIFKVNMNTNQVTELTLVSGNPSYPTPQPLYWDSGMQNLRNVREINGEIYFNGLQTQIYKINPNNNTITHLTNVSYNYEVLNNNLIPSNGFSVTNLDNLSQYYNPTTTIDGFVYNIELDGTNLKIGNHLYTIGKLYNGAAPLNYTRKLFKINSASYPSLGFEPLYTFSSDIGYMQGFVENGGYPILLNNRILWKRSDDQGVIYIASFDLDTNSFNPNLYMPENIFGEFQYFLFNNNLYIKNSQDQFLVTNGWSTPVLSAITNFYKYGSDFSFNQAYPYPGYSDKPIVEYNGILFGKNNGTTSSAPRQIWKTDGTTAGTQMIYNGLDLYSAKVYNGNLYAYGNYTSVSNSYDYPKLFRFNNSNNTFESIWTFPQTGSFAFSSHLFFFNNNVFFTGRNGDTMPEGLYKLNLSTLSTSEISDSKNNLALYPNPTNNFITLQTKNNSIENFKYEIVDLTGRIVKSDNSKFNEKINIENLTSGNYIIKIEMNSGQKTNLKLIKN